MKEALCLAPVVVAIWLAAAALQNTSYTLSWAALIACWVACVVGYRALGEIRWSRRAAIAGALVLAPLWFADFNSPHQWDAVQTAIRAEIYWETGRMERFSLFYPILAPFVALAPGSSIPSHLLVMVLGVGTIFAVALLSASLAGRTGALRMGLLVPLLPPVFLLYRWVMLDTLLVLLWMLTLLASIRWARELTPARLAAIVVLTLLTAAAKEMGVLIVFPVLTALVVLGPRRQLTLRLGVAVAVLLVAAFISIGILKRYAELKNISNYFQELVYSDRGLTFLIGQKGKMPEPLRHYLKVIIRQHLAFWMQTGLIVPITFALIRVIRARAAVMLLTIGAVAQLIWMIFTCRPDRWPDIYTYPLFDGTLPSRLLAPLAVYVAATIYFLSRGDIRLRVTPKVLVLLAAILPGYLLLHCFVKAHPDVDYIHIWVAWHYLVVLFVSALPLAAAGFRAIGRIAMPGPLRQVLLFVAMLTIMNGLLHGVGMALAFRTLNESRLEAYERMKTQPVRVVYTHWPFSGADAGTSAHNNGPLAWHSDGWKVSELYQFGDRDKVPTEESLFLYATDRGYGLPMGRMPRMADPIDIIRASRWRLGLFNFTMERDEIDAAVVRRFPGEWIRRHGKREPAH